MGYDSNRIADSKFLLFEFLKVVGYKIADPSQDSGMRLDEECLWLDVLSSFHTEKDETFSKEWQEIQEARKSAPWEDGEDAAQDREFRLLEMKCIVRSLYRRGHLTNLPAPTTEWTPDV